MSSTSVYGDGFPIVEITEETKPYTIIMFNNSNEDVRDVGKKTRPDFKLYVESAKKLGIKIYNVEYTGLYCSFDNGKIYLNSLDFDEDGNDDTTTYTFSNNVLELVIPEGSDNGTDTTFIIPVSNLTSNSADLLFYDISETIYEVDSSFGITVFDFTISSSITWRVIK